MIGHTLTNACKGVTPCVAYEDTDTGKYIYGPSYTEAGCTSPALDREPRYEKSIVDRNVANVENLKNHPSVVVWSLGNECGGGSSFRTALQAVRAIDSTRPTHYEPFGGGPNLPTDIESHMYTNPTELKAAGEDPKRTKPLYLCEYAHAMNNSMGSVGDYNDLFDKYPTLMGERSGNGRIRASGMAAIRTTSSWPTAAALGIIRTTSTSFTKVWCFPTARPSRTTLS